MLNTELPITRLRQLRKDNNLCIGYGRARDSLQFHCSACLKKMSTRQAALKKNVVARASVLNVAIEPSPLVHIRSA